MALCAVAWLAVAGGLFVAAGAVADSGYQTEVYAYGTVDLSLVRDGGRAVEVNRQRRGDNPFDLVQVNVFGDIAVGDRLTVYNQVLYDPSARQPSNSFLRTWLQYTLLSSAEGDLHLQLGLLPTPFGHFTERSYTDRNPLIGYPLMYHHFSSLRANQLPADNRDLLRHRGQGVADRFTGFAGGGSTQAFAGLPLVYDTCWDFGGGLLGSLWRFEYLLAITQGTLSDPRANAVDSNDGQQVAARLGLVPFTGMLVRASYARGPYLDRAVARGLAAGQQVEDFVQEIAGLSAEFEYRHLVLVGEVAANRWESPNIVDRAGRSQDLEVSGFYVEGRYKLRPGLFAAARYSGLRYGDIDDGQGSGRSVPWDYDADRVEFGLGYWFTDGVLGRVVGQLNDLHNPADRDDRLATARLTVGF